MAALLLVFPFGLVSLLQQKRGQQGDTSWGRVLHYDDACLQDLAALLQAWMASRSSIVGPLQQPVLNHECREKPISTEFGTRPSEKPPVMAKTGSLLSAYFKSY